jgi:hypothetical protein
MYTGEFIQNDENAKLVQQVDKKYHIQINGHFSFPLAA